MKPLRIEWDDYNERHFRERGRCSIEEVNDVLRERCHVARTRQAARRDGEPRQHVEGQTCGDRPLVIVVHPRPERTVRPVTCLHLRGEDLRKYRAWRATVKR